MHANLHQQEKSGLHCDDLRRSGQSLELMLFELQLCSCLEGVTFLVLGATGSLFSFRSSQSKSAAFLKRLGLQMQMKSG